MVKPEIVSRKVAAIQDFLKRIEPYQKYSPAQFQKDRDAQDIVCFNLFQAIQSLMDIAHHIVSDAGWAVPGSYGEIIDQLVEKGILSLEQGEVFRQMIGFRNLLAHQYLKIDLDEVHTILIDHLPEFKDILDTLIRYCKL